MRNNVALPRLLGLSNNQYLGFGHDLMLILRSQLFEFVREMYYRLDLECLETVRPQKYVNTKQSLRTELPTVSGRFCKARRRSGHIFAARVSSRTSTRNLVYDPLFRYSKRSVRCIPTSVKFEQVLRSACMRCGNNFGVMGLNQPVYNEK